MKYLVVALLLLSGCASIAINAAPKKKANPVQSEQSKAANDVFWTALHAGNYDALPGVIELLQQAYLADPTDAITTAHLGFAHIWKAAERVRLEKVPATITDHLLLSQRYFAEAFEMTNDWRFAGFLAGAELANGTIHKDEKLVRQGFFRMKEAVAAFPEFNLFASGYQASSAAVDSDRFKQGLEAMWKNVDFCFDGKVSRADPDYGPVMFMETQVGTRRVCWNNWITPHNHEGFALNLGDMLVKAGDLKAGRRMYENAKLSKTYAQWPYKDLLEKRLANINENTEIFRKPTAEVPKDRLMMYASEANCAGCHADAPAEVAATTFTQRNENRTHGR